MTAIVSFMLRSSSRHSHTRPGAGEGRRTETWDDRAMSSEEVVTPAGADPILIVGASQAAASTRPGRLRRFAAGAWHVPGGAIFLLRHPRLWPLALLPALLGVAAVVGGLVLGVYGVRAVDETLGPHRPKLPDLIDLAGVLGVMSGTLASGVLAALTAVLLVSAPFLDGIGRRAEAAYEGAGAVTRMGVPEVLAALRHSLYLVAVVPLVFVLCVIPFAGPVLAVLLTALVLSFQLTAAPLARHGRDFRAMWQWHREWRAETLGFGVAAVVLLPLLSAILAPALAVGASLLVHEIDDPGSASTDPVH
jgi:uncharacterized protein involved in cysteine biosynthesis